MTSSVPRAVLFDLGNTLVDYHVSGPSDEEKDFLGVKNMADALVRWRVPVSHSRLWKEFYLPWSRRLRYRRLKKAEYDLVAWLEPVLPSEASTPRRIRALISAFHEPFVRFAQPLPGALEALQALRERKWLAGVVSNSPLPGFCHDTTLRHLGMLDSLSVRLYSYDFGVRKPGVGILQAALRRMHVEACNSVLVGDSWYDDILPALSLGMRAVYCPAPRSKRVVPSSISATTSGCTRVQSLHELPSAVGLPNR